MVLFLWPVFSATMVTPLALGQQPGKAATRIQLTASTVEGPSRTQAAFTAQVFPSDASARTIPTGSVSFMNGEQSIGAALLDDAGRATYTADALPAGLRKITAVYQGDDSFQASHSLSAEVNSATSGVPGFTLSASTSAMKIVAGQTATTVITATPENGFNQAVALSCSGVPYASVTCVFTPAQITPGAATTAAPGGVPALSTLSIQTTAASGATLRGAPGPEGQSVYVAAIPGVLALIGLALARRKSGFGNMAAQRLLSLLLLLVAGGMGLGGCAQRYHYYHRPPEGNPGTPAGTYTVVISGITGTGSSLSTGTVTVTLTVTSS